MYKGHDGGVQRLDLKCGNGQIGINYDGSVFVNWDPIADIVIDQNTSGIWTYRKWKSGIAECWGTCSVTYKADFVAYEQTALPFSFPQIVAMTTGLADWNNDSTVTWDWNTRVYMLNNSSIVPMVYSPGRGHQSRQYTPCLCIRLWEVEVMGDPISREEHEEFVKRMEGDHKRIDKRLALLEERRAAKWSADHQRGKAGPIRPDHE